MWDRIEIWARQLRYGFFILTIGVFIATYWSAFQDNEPLMYLFLVSGFLWMLSIAYVDIREAARFARGMHKQTPLGRSNRRQGRNKTMRWLRTHAFGVGITVVFAAAAALYFIPFNTPKPWWGAVLAVIGPLVMWLTRRVELRGRDNENLIRQLEPLIKDTGDLEFTIRGFARDLLSNQDVKNELGSFGVQGWTYYIERLGDQQIVALNSLKIS